MAWDDLLAYLNTASSLHTFRERNPEDAKNPEGDLAVRFWKKLREETKAQPGSEEAVDVEWPLTLMMVKRT
ncbi:hypothetical protein FA95DRAFT_1556996 [Auriscalpium vulgare]|uniref:Uncharacterized protein n=1 Tax=Auriscalpium vulgare TaxID=40419 RepID=A0ACB8S0K6_9AGAM|nr:hypothetical protein FA95DRAFT_1556996 [Auriscalpium vulgare]